MRRTRPRGVVGLVAAALLVPVVSGCCRRPPQGIVEVNLALSRAKDACAVVYAPDNLAAIERRVDEINRLADARKCRRARAAAQPMMRDVLAFADLVELRRDLARVDAEDALAGAEAALTRARAVRNGGDPSAELAAAERALAVARSMRGDACAYPTVAGLAREAAEVAGRSKAEPPDGEREERRP